MSVDRTSISTLPGTNSNVTVQNAIQSQNQYVENPSDALAAKRDSDMKSMGIGMTKTGPPPGIASGPNDKVSQDNINRMLPGLQQATMDGLTALQSRDIPKDTTSLVQDPVVAQPIAIPPHERTGDYIGSVSPIVTSTQNDGKNRDIFDYIYDELHTPIIVGILFFIFSQPSFRKKMISFAPAVLSNDGNMRPHGFIAMSLMFASTFYCVDWVYHYLNRM